MAIPFLNNIDLNGNQVLNARLQNLAAAPSSLTGVGSIYFDTALSRPRWSPDGSTWVDVYPSATANTASTTVLRDGSGNFSAGTITATLSGNASTATTLQTARNFSISGKATATAVSFNGSAAVDLNITSLSVAPAEIGLTSGYFIVGNGANVGQGYAKTSIPLSGFGAAAADVSMGGYKITSLAEPTNGTDAATKNYVDAAAQGLDVKQSVRLATITALPTSTYSSITQRITASANGALGVDGIVPAIGDRVLVKNEGTASRNGIYVVIAVGDAYAPFVLERSLDFNSSAEASPGSFTFVEEGLNLADTGWVMTADAPITLDTTTLTWVQFSGTGSYSAGRGLVLSGTTFHFGQSTAYTIGDIFYASGASSMAALAAAATGNALISGGAAAAPSWGKIGLTTHVTGTLGVANGGTGAATLTANGVLLGNGTSAISAAAPGAAAQVFLANGSSVPTWTALSGDITIGSTGVTALRNGSATSVIGRSANSTGAVADIAASADKQFLRRVSGVLGFGSLIFAGTLGAGTQTSFDVTHSLGTQDCLVFVYQAGSPYAQVFTDIEMKTTNIVTVRFAAAVTGTNYRVVVIGF